MKLKVLIVDDEAPARGYLAAILGEFPDIEVVGQAASWTECLDMVGKFDPDGVFLDIRLPELNGLEVADRLSDLPNAPFVVFVTGYDEYAVQAFEASALDYVLKPFQKDRIEKALKKLRRAVTDRDKHGNIHEDAEIPTTTSFSVSRLPIKEEGNIYLINPNEIVYAQCENKKVYIWTDDRNFKTNFTLGQLESKLNGKNFFRANEGCLVNMEMVKEVNYLGSETYELVLSDKDETIIPLSRSRARILRQQLGW